jgi:hypothetical protein
VQKSDCDTRPSTYWHNDTYVMWPDDDVIPGRLFREGASAGLRVKLKPVGGAAPEGLAQVIGVLSWAGPVNLAALLHHHAHDPARPLATLGITLG